MIRVVEPSQRDVQVGHGIDRHRSLRDSSGMPQQADAITKCSSLHRCNRRDVLNDVAGDALLQLAKEAWLTLRQTSFQILGHDLRLCQRNC